jgi:protein-S-isoprenylcysteine O-methyltransferase Ste14
MSKLERTFAWSGGVIFVASLAVCAYCYLIVWASPATHRLSLGAIAIDALLVTVFAVHHSVFAREQMKGAVARIVPERLLRSFYVWVASVLFILVCVLWVPVGADVYRTTGWRAAIHAGVQLYGLWLIAQAVRGIDPLELAGIRSETERGPLQIRGPYAFVRHPLYFGWLLAVLGSAHMTGDRLAFGVITTLYLVLAIPWEERSLMRSFGEDYARYQRAVRWRIVPFIY